MNSFIPHFTFCIRHLAAALLLTPCALLAAPPPELTLLRQHYDKVVAEKVTAPFDAALGTLNTKFTAALNNAAADAKKTGSLPAVLAIEADKKRITEKLPLPDADDEQTPDSLKKLRVIYREQSAKLDAQRAANHSTILPGYTAKLKELETTLTKADRVDEAKEVMTYREGLAVGAVAAASLEVKPAAFTTTKTAGTPPADAGPKVSAEDASRQLVEWAVQNGHSATVASRKGSLVIKAAQDIPKEKFDLIKIETSGADVASTGPPWRLFQFTPNVDRIYLGIYSLPFMPADMAMLHKLTKLKFLEIKAKVEDVSGVVQAMPEFPSLTELIFSYPINGNDLLQMVRKYPMLLRPCLTLDDSLSDDEFAVVSGWKKAITIRFDYMKAPLTHAKAVVLTKMPAVTALGFFYPASVPLEPSIAGQLSKITSVQVYYTLPEKRLDGICSLPALENLWLGKIDALDDAALAPLAAANKLKTLSLSGDSKLTDAALDQLKGLKKLKELNLKDTAITDAALAAFKKARPDVKVEK